MNKQALMVEVLALEGWQKEELERRLKAFEADPQGQAWKDVLERIRAK